MTRLYKIYTSTEYNNLDLSLYQDSIRWNNNNTKCILEFINTPHGNTITLTHAEALLEIQKPEWVKEINF